MITLTEFTMATPPEIEVDISFPIPQSERTALSYLGEKQNLAQTDMGGEKFHINRSALEGLTKQPRYPCVPTDQQA